MSNIARGTARKRQESRSFPSPPDNSTSSEPDSEAVAEIARYIAQLTAEMCRMAGSVKLDTLAYFLSMARLEAEMLARRETTPYSHSRMDQSAG